MGRAMMINSAAMVHQRAMARRNMRMRYQRTQDANTQRRGRSMTLEALEPMTVAAEGKFRIVDYGKDLFTEFDADDTQEELLSDRSRKEGAAVRWISYDGIKDVCMNCLARTHTLNPLAVHLASTIPSRVMQSIFPEHYFMVTRCYPELPSDQRYTEDVAILPEQVSIFVNRTSIITIQEGIHHDPWHEVRRQVAHNVHGLRDSDVSSLFAKILATNMSGALRIIAGYGDRLTEIEIEVADHPTHQDVQRINLIKKNLLIMRRDLKPMLECVRELLETENTFLSEPASVSLNNLKNKLQHAVEEIAGFTDLCESLTEEYRTRLDERIDKILYGLTIMTLLFEPASFFAGVYGMNFTHMPELKWEYSYLVWWIVSIVATFILVAVFRVKRYI